MHVLQNSSFVVAVCLRVDRAHRRDVRALKGDGGRDLHPVGIPRLKEVSAAGGPHNVLAVVRGRDRGPNAVRTNGGRERPSRRGHAGVATSYRQNLRRGAAWSGPGIVLADGAGGHGRAQEGEERDGKEHGPAHDLRNYPDGAGQGDDGREVPGGGDGRGDDEVGGEDSGELGQVELGGGEEPDGGVEEEEEVLGYLHGEEVIGGGLRDLRGREENRSGKKQTEKEEEKEKEKKKGKEREIKRETKKENRRQML